MVLNFFKSGVRKIKDAMSKTGSVFGGKIRALFGSKIDEGTIEKLEKIFYESDLGIASTRLLTDKAREAYRRNPAITGEELIEELRKELLDMLSQEPSGLRSAETGPTVIMIVGVNGNGKTTSIAKLSKMLKDSGKKVLVAAADTFRAAAIEQLETWAGRVGVDIVKGNVNSDPAAVAFDAVTAAKARQADFVLIDTAGRLHTKTNLMQELEKIKRSCNKVLPGAPHETLLILDSTTGQNAIDQAAVFHKHTPISGLILTKLDGTAKGGIAVNIERQLKIPIKFVGVGEGMDDLEPFDPQAFIDGLLKY